jgi:hypothetical protein
MGRKRKRKANELLWENKVGAKIERQRKKRKKMSKYIPNLATEEGGTYKEIHDKLIAYKPQYKRRKAEYKGKTFKRKKNYKARGVVIKKRLSVRPHSQRYNVRYENGHRARSSIKRSLSRKRRLRK